MDYKGHIAGEYQVTLTYSGLTMEELCQLLKLTDNGGLYRFGDGYSYLRDLKVGKDYDRDCEGWEEPAGTYNITYIVGQCGGICKDSWIKFINDKVQKAYDAAEKLRQFIKDKTGIE